MTMWINKILLVLIIVIPLYADTTSIQMPITFPWQKELSQKKNKTILDYFLLLPSEYLDCENVKSGFPSVEERKKLCKLIDEKNGYIQFFNAAEIALFKNRQDSIDFVALQIGKCGAGATCGGVNTILQFSSSKNYWIKRDDLLPKGFSFELLYEIYSEEDRCPYFKLPQKGVVIEIRDENTEKVLKLLKWNGVRFSVDK
jgi:hypothetical protein